MKHRLTAVMLCMTAPFVLQAEVPDAYRYLNDVRASAGLIAFDLDADLEQASENHAEYCSLNRIGGHFESEGMPAYTGRDPADRAIHAGYMSRAVLENVSAHSGEAGHRASVDNLMAAIYHRFGFLSFEHDEIGIGRRDEEGFRCYVYNIGHEARQQLCRTDPADDPGTYYTNVCADPSFRVMTDVMEQSISSIRRQNPAVVIWPPDGAEDVQPAFFEESPDPLPYHSVSGYPVSIQFNPAYFDEPPLVTRFEVFEEGAENPLPIIRRMDAESDQHGKFTEFEHTIFPVDRFDWGGDYRAVVEYRIGDDSEVINWGFRIRGLPHRVFQPEGPKPNIEVSPDETFIIYMPPRHGDDAALSYRLSYMGLRSLDVKIIDGNTLEVTPRGMGVGEIRYRSTSIQIIVR